MSDETRPLLVSRDGDIASLTLNRPRVRNAVSHQLLEAIEQTLDELLHDRPRVIVLRAAAPGFCAGIDLKETLDAPPAFVRERVSTMHRVLRKLRALPVPIVAAIDGSAVGLGVELAISADLRFATAASRFSYREVAVAVPSPAHHLVRIVGLTRAQDLLLTARWMEADEAERVGLITRLVPDAEAAAANAAREIAELAPRAVQDTKENIWISVRVGVEAASLHHIDGVAMAALTVDRREALAAFREKRPPHFVGR
ncbi:MAG TPA: enoyl-CoA hydratase/isomerase family protein [Thermomicrobiaceae bacterium]|nr:enoyl-CoA hydratase/isomerase family protein [Thermomicrobiaceae bacterium]